MTERSRLEDRLRAAAIEWEQTFDAWTDHVCILDRTGKILRTNRRMRERFEPIHGELIGLDYRVIYCGTATPEPQPPCAAVLSGHPPVTCEARLPTMDGWFEISSFPLFDDERRQWGAVSVVRDITAQKLAEQGLREREQRLRAIFTTAVDAILTIDEAGLIVEFNPAAEQLFGHDRADVVGREMAELIVPPSLREAHRAGMARYLATGEQHVLDRRLELSAIRSDGTEFPVEIVICAATREGQRIFTGFIRDITERKRHEEQMNRVLGELNHRVKNTLAIVDSIARQTIRRSPDLAAFQERFSQRLRSMAAAHTLLTQGHWQGVALHEIIRVELGAQVAAADQYAVSGADIVLRPSAALALHMVTHELATNASKHGALATDEGRISIDASIDEDPVGGGRRVRLLWTEVCSRPVHEPETTGYGSELMSQLVEYELQGELERTFHPQGLRCRIAFDLEGNGVPAGPPAR